MKGQPKTNQTPPRRILIGHSKTMSLMSVVLRAMAGAVPDLGSGIHMGRGTGSTRKGFWNVHKVTNKFPPSLQGSGVQECKRRRARMAP